MKHLAPFFLVLGLMATHLASLSTGSAQTYAQDDAGAYTGATGNAAWLYSATTNGGFGFTPWSFLKAGPGFQGFYVGNPGTIGVSNKSWGMYANNTPTNFAVAYRGFTNGIPANGVFRIKWQTHGIGGADYNFGGFSLRTGNANASINDYTNGERMAFFYRGGTPAGDDASLRDAAGEYNLPYPTIQ